MSEWLLEITFGPVQGFIASARRSRDLWAGSRLLSEVARGAALALREGDARLIYPADAAVDAVTDTGNLSNTLLAIVDAADEHALRQLVKDVQQAGRDALGAIANHEIESWRRALAPHPLREDLWMTQVQRAIDSYAAWARLDDPSDYDNAHRALKQALIERKNTRDFAPHAAAEDGFDLGIPKSSLDGVNESVLPKHRGRAQRCMGLGEGEQLDALGCIKRSFGRQETFTALPRLAADPWLEWLQRSDAATADALRNAYAPLVGHGFATHSRGNKGCYDTLPFDAGLLFGGALEQAIVEARHDRDDAAVKALRQLGDVLREIPSRPNPYVALLVADGDRMGKFLEHARTHEQHTAVSKAIASFSNAVPVIARDHRGHAIYHGGEDLMVAYPLKSAVAGARALSTAFAEYMQPMIDSLLPTADDRSDGLPTLRAGLAICHLAEPMGFIRRAAEDAEKLAKGDAGSAQQGDALGICLHLRAGQQVQARYGFSNAAAENDFDRFYEWQKAYAGKQRTLSARVAFDIRDVGHELLRLLRGMPGDDTIAQSQTIARNSFERILARAESSGGGTEIDEKLRTALRARLATYLQRYDGEPAKAYRAMGDELILARWMSAAEERELGVGEQGR